MMDIESHVNTEEEHKVESRAASNSCRTSISSPSPSSDYITGDTDDSSEEKYCTPSALKLAESQLLVSKDATLDDLEQTVERCKQMILESAECTEERKWLVRCLIELRLRVQELRDKSDETSVGTRVILGHHFEPRRHQVINTSTVYCDHCSCGIWTILQSWYTCSDCGFSCHWKCLTSIRRVCAHVVATETGGYTHTRDICPERGLSMQSYRCAECGTSISFKAAWIEPRLCDYNGLYYCQRCHWNTTAVIPARVIRNWDTEPRKVSRAAAQLLALLEERPVLNLEELNPKLFSLVPDLSLVKKLREELQMIKKYLVFCTEATNQGLPWRAGLRAHLVANSNSYAIKDLVDLQNGTLVEEIRVAYDAMRNHITETCELCKARGHLCELCGNDEVIYPWDAGAISCQKCSTIFHRVCWSKRNNCCPKCIRIRKRLTLDEQEKPNAIIDDENNDPDDVPDAEVRR